MSKVDPATSYAIKLINGKISEKEYRRAVCKVDGQEIYVANLTNQIKTLEGYKAALATRSMDRAGWQPIASAPKDGGSILVCCADKMDSQKVVGWDDDGKDGFNWGADDAGMYHELAFTHWKPLDPQPPHP